VKEDLHLAPYRRCLWEEAGLLVVSGDVSRALLSRDVYNGRYGIRAPGDERGTKLDRALAAAGLSAISLVERESWGWSMTFPGDDFGLFIGVEPEGMICGGVHGAERERAKVALQRQKAGEPLVESHYGPVGDDPVRAVELYFERSIQTPTRIAVSDAGPGALCQVVPGGDFSRVSGRTDEELLALLDELSAGQSNALRVLDEVVLFYECRCNDDMVIDMIKGLPEDQQREVWGDSSELEIECPRCGREYVVKRKTVRRQ